jgi:hypothetical protein
MKVIILVGISLFSMVAWAQKPSNDAAKVSAQERCERLGEMDLSLLQDAPTQVTSAQYVSEAVQVPSYCQVDAYVAPQVGFEIRLPTVHWNSKLLALGSGGWGGAFDGDACNPYLKRGYACLVTDTGHKGGLVDGLWAHNNLPAQVDFGYRSIHVSTLAGKAIVERY